MFNVGCMSFFLYWSSIFGAYVDTMLPFPPLVTIINNYIKIIEQLVIYIQPTWLDRTPIADENCPSRT